jgi:hypothetical protein
VDFTEENVTGMEGTIVDGTLLCMTEEYPEQCDIAFVRGGNPWDWGRSLNAEGCGECRPENRSPPGTNAKKSFIALESIIVNIGDWVSGKYSGRKEFGSAYIDSHTGLLPRG